MTISLVGAAATDVPTPALVVIGEVVAVREALARCCANSRVVATADLSRRRSAGGRRARRSIWCLAQSLVGSEAALSRSASATASDAGISRPNCSRAAKVASLMARRAFSMGPWRSASEAGV
jgi:hypothetical protein